MIQLIFLIICVIFGIIVYLSGALDLLGSFFVTIIGIFIVLSRGFNWLAILLLFLILGSAFTQFKKDYKRRIGLVHEKRTIRNVISNGIIPVIMAIFGNYAGFIGAIATAIADTMASEIGVLSEPVLITTKEHVKPGTDGGISLLGTVAGLIGALIIGVSAFIVNVSPDITHSICIAIIAGFIGCFADSLLGATLERNGLFNNEHVNLTATIIGALVGIIITIGA
ncbi:TIGR00297 family protein [Methanosphaera sp. WGK6]|uniref:TIGR00297 family protein n=1 Tax=Methanosphaera sp. WGK6 TaxID=1561964 RepID=UPI00084C70B5|nr:TIGR00297 family protein [Methanosphaera sp. WGK6]OED30637.1 membrane protein [Methanosphaera sp. WGK6]